MKWRFRVIGFVLAIVPATAGAVVAETIEAFWPGGQIKVRYDVNEDGQKHGRYDSFYEDGKPQVHAVYQHDQLEGTYRSFHPSGRRHILAKYDEGQLDGRYSEYDEAGRPIRLTDYRHGKRSGVDRAYVDGKLVREQTFIDDLLIHPKSQAMMRRTLAEIARAPVEIVGGEDGAAIPNARQQIEAVRLLMSYRYICDVPWEGLAIDRDYVDHNEAAAKLLKQIGRLDHTPANPGWDDADYRKAYKGTSSSNLSQGSSIVGSVHSYMDDSDPSNIKTVGHRRWCLNPAMGKTGFGSDGQFGAMWAMDRSRADVPDNQFVAYPAPGYMPATFFGAHHAWHISLNPKHYQAPQEGSVDVAVYPVEISIGSGRMRQARQPLANKVLYIDHGGYGINNAIIFQPKGISTRPRSTYLVEITGLKAKGDAPVPLRYVIEFCRF